MNMTGFEFSAEAYLTNVESERVVLGSILLDSDLLKDCHLVAENFGVGQHKVLFEVFKDMEKKEIPVDITSVCEVAGANRLALMGGLNAIMELANSVFVVSNFDYHQGTVMEYYKKRKLYEIGRNMMQNAVSLEVDEIIKNTIENFEKLEDSGGGLNDGDQAHIKNVLVRTHAWMEQDHGKIAGATTGYKDLDRILSGMKKQDLIIVGARPSVGKTAFAVNVGINHANSEPTELQPQGGPVALFSLEMKDLQLSLRMLSNVGNIDAQRIRNPNNEFKSDDWTRTMQANAHLSRNPFHIFDKPGADMGYIRKQLRWMRKKYPNQHVVVIIDYLQLIVGNPKLAANRQQDVSDISRGLKLLARELDMTIIALSQLSRKVEERANKRPMLSDLRESGAIEQDADVIAFLYRDDYYDAESEAQNLIEINVAKQRNGPVGTVLLAFVKEYSKFVNIAEK